MPSAAGSAESSLSPSNAAMSSNEAATISKGPPKTSSAALNVSPSEGSPIASAAFPPPVSNGNICVSLKNRREKRSANELDSASSECVTLRRPKKLATSFANSCDDSSVVFHNCLRVQFVSRAFSGRPSDICALANPLTARRRANADTSAAFCASLMLIFVLMFIGRAGYVLGSYDCLITLIFSGVRNHNEMGAPLQGCKVQAG